MFAFYIYLNQIFFIMELNKTYNINCLDGISLLKKQDLIPNLIICDPPYEFENKGGGLYSLKRTKKIMNKIKEIGTDSFNFDLYIPHILDLQKDKVNAYFFCNKALLPKYLNLAVERNLILDILILHKKNPIPSFNNSFMNDVEYIVFLRSKGVYFSSKQGYKCYKKVFEVVIGSSNYVHPNQKPTELLRNFIKISSDKKDLILDCFMGSGSLGIACKEEGRSFIGFEINEEYSLLSNTRYKTHSVIKLNSFFQN